MLSDMSEVLYFNKVGYISSTSAAECFGVTRDYITKLCRNQTITARRVGKNWYVAENAFKEYLLTHLYNKSARRESLTKDRLKEYQDSVHTIPIRVEHSPATSTHKKHFLAVPAPTQTIQERMAEAVAAQSSEAVEQLSPYMNAPSGIAHAALQTTHIPIYALSPFVEVLHRLTAILFAVFFVLSVYAIANPDKVNETVSLIQSGSRVFSVADFVDSASSAVSNMSTQSHVALLALANISFSQLNPTRVHDTIRTVQNYTEDVGQSASSLLRGTIATVSTASSSDASVSVSVQPYTMPAQTPSILQADTLCVGTVCVTQDQFLAMVRIANKQVTQERSTSLNNTFRPIVSSTSPATSTRK